MDHLQSSHLKLVRLLHFFPPWALLNLGVASRLFNYQANAIWNLKWKKKKHGLMGLLINMAGQQVQQGLNAMICHRPTVNEDNVQCWLTMGIIAFVWHCFITSVYVKPVFLCTSIACQITPCWGDFRLRPLLRGRLVVCSCLISFFIYILLTTSNLL